MHKIICIKIWQNSTNYYEIQTKLFNKIQIKFKQNSNKIIMKISIWKYQYENIIKLIWKYQYENINMKISIWKYYKIWPNPKKTTGLAYICKIQKYKNKKVKMICRQFHIEFFIKIDLENDLLQV